MWFVCVLTSFLLYAILPRYTERKGQLLTEHYPACFHSRCRVSCSVLWSALLVWCRIRRRWEKAVMVGWFDGLCGGTWSAKVFLRCCEEKGARLLWTVFGTRGELLLIWESCSKCSISKNWSGMFSNEHSFPNMRSKQDFQITRHGTGEYILSLFHTKICEHQTHLYFLFNESKELNLNTRRQPYPAFRNIHPHPTLSF